MPWHPRDDAAASPAPLATAISEDDPTMQAPAAPVTVALDRVFFPPLGRITDDTSVLTLRSLVFEPLCRWRDGAIGAGLFGSWRHEAEGREWRFTMRPGAAFHDGVPCTAAHVEASIAATLQGRDMFGMPWSYARYLAGARIEAMDAATLRIETPEPLADLPEILAEFFLAREAPDGQAVIGTGPYRVVAHRPDESVELQAVNSTRRPSVLRLVASKDAEARFAMLRDGTADVAMNLEHRAEPPGGHGLEWGRAVTTLSVMFYLNCAEGLFRSPAARLAANLAVDRQAILNRLFHGRGVLAAKRRQPLPPRHGAGGARAHPARPGPGTRAVRRGRRRRPYPDPHADPHAGACAGDRGDGCA
jgi:peptide/nickel transport system substrate-binding protein